MANDGFFDPSGIDELDWLKLAVAHSGTGIWNRDVVSGRMSYSPAWKAMLGYSESDIGASIPDSYKRVHPDDLARTQSAILDHLAGRTKTVEIEHRLLCKDGSYKWVLSRGQAVSRGPDGEALRVLGTTVDISATVALSEQLRQSAELLVNLTDEVPGMVYQYRATADGSASFTYASAGIIDIFGITPQQALAEPGLIEARIHPEHIESYRSALAKSAATLKPCHLEFRVMLPSRPAGWRELDARPRRVHDGSIIWHGFMSDITEHKRLEQLLKDAAATDFLTGLPNRRSIMQRMDQELGRIGRDPHAQAAVLMFDLDHFKHINDRHGHAAGDQVLQHFSGILQHELRKQDSVGRIGGEEFIVVLAGVGMPEAVSFAERVRERLASMPPLRPDGSLPVTVSVGVAAMLTTDPDIASVLGRADAALYVAKQTGRDRIEAAAS
jgi:diguanylate cyclase (GGDEF)-like protein/PAS domain S-box-containing protein